MSGAAPASSRPADERSPVGRRAGGVVRSAPASRPPANRRSAQTLAALAIAACSAGPDELVFVPGTGTPPVAVNETREVELRYLEMNVTDFRQTLTLADLRAIPRAVLDDLWLMDLDLTGFVTNALTQLAATPPEAIADPAARNLQRLITMSPNNVNLDGTSMAPIVDLSRAIGIPPQHAVADLMQSADRNAAVIPLDIATDALLADLVSHHPRAAPPHAIPIRLGDVVDNFAHLAERFGPAALSDGRLHPGIIRAASGYAVVQDDFAMTVRVNANALPYKGVDLETAGPTSVNSVGSQIEHLFPVDEPDWILVEGLVGAPTIGDVTVGIAESPLHFPPGTSREPLPHGSSPVWAADPWLIERMVADMAWQAAQRMTAGCVTYDVASGATVFEACTDATGWVEFRTFNDVGSPPPPGYIWDIIVELAQVRLHDAGLAEGTANAELSLHDVALGLTAGKLVELIKTNLAANPAALRELAEATSQSTRGETDFFYVRPRGTDEDWLHFVAEADIPRSTTGGRVRPYTYAHPGFFADAELSRQLGGLAPDTGVQTDPHLRLQVRPGSVFYCEDEGGRVFRVEVREKPGRARLPLAITRIR